jgi:branched-chain amino acid transport system ATP-binding protein
MILQGFGLCKSFGGVAAVNGVDLEAKEGGVEAVIGPNGAGKTTLFNLLTGRLHLDRGRIVFNGTDITGLAAYRISRLGLVRTFQITSVFPRLTVLQNVQGALFVKRGRGVNFTLEARNLFRREAEAILQEVGLGDQAMAPGGSLSHGDQKRLELGIALAQEPRMLLLDEPTAGMAPAERKGLLGLLVSVVSQRGLTLLFTEHDMDVVFSVAQRILVMHQGAIIAAGPPEAVRTNDEVKRAYLGEARWLWKSKRRTPTTG